MTAVIQSFIIEIRKMASNPWEKLSTLYSRRKIEDSKRSRIAMAVFSGSIRRVK